MDDKRIVELFFERSEAAIKAAERKYGKYCHYIASRILNSREDEDECLNGVLLRAWSSIPPKMPNDLKGYLGKLTRNLALNMLERTTAKKRGGGDIEAVLDELSECVGGSNDPESIIDALAIRQALNRFLAALTPEAQRIFTRRYFYISSVKEIANEYGITESKVGVTLYRAREKLKEFLKEEGIEI